MYKLSVPFLLEQIDKYGADQFISELKKIGADIVFLALDCYEMDESKQAKVFNSLKVNVPILQKAGFTVGVWVWTYMIRDKNDFTHITSPSGKVSKLQVCPSDERFRDFAYTYMQNIAKSNPDMIMFDDDFRYGYLDCGLGCTCENHRKYMAEILGEEVPTENLSKLIFGGGKNKYRSAYLKANGYFMREFARSSRRAVDSINPSIRLGLCSCMTTWDFDGVSTAELAHILAGDTKPFCRLIGAPYWSDKRSFFNCRLQDVIELERMESSWCDDEIELFAEGDCYPRPRFTCPANVLDGYDMALRASGAVDGIHKYTLDYSADVNYERGYNAKHLKNQPIYRKIDEHFSDKSPVGVRVYEKMTKFEDMDVIDKFDGKDDVQTTFFSPSAQLLAAQTIPTIYEGLGVVGIAFGENAKYLSNGAKENGLILDITSAKILTKLGVDVGLESVGEKRSASQEYLPSDNRYIGLFGCQFYDIAVNKDAKVLSYFISGEQKSVGTYSYENAQGQKFLVFAFDGFEASEHAIKQYARGTLIENWIKSIGKTLPVSMLGNPDCYMLCKENENKEKAVWIGNFFADECLNTTVILDREYTQIEFINCTGKLNGNIVEIDYIAPYASLGFVVK